MVLMVLKFLPQNKKRRKTTQDTVYSAMSSIPSGGPPGGTHTQELWYSLRGTDARLESVLSTDECLCDACCARSQPLILLFLFSYFGLKNFLYGQARFCTDVSIFATFLHVVVVVVVVVHQGNCWEEVELHRQRPGSQMF